MKLRVIHILSLFAIFAMTALVSIAQSPAHDAHEESISVAGTWTLSTQGHHGGAMNQNMSIQQEGNKISGTIFGQQGEDQLRGSLDGNDITFTVNRNTHHGSMTFVYRGTVQGDSMRGTIQGSQGGSWSAKRKAG